MKQRCNNPKSNKYEIYGGRGIIYDTTWNDFYTFLQDMGERPEGCTLDRIDPNGNYNKENCRWSTIEVQNRNTRTSKLITYEGITKTNQEWANQLGIPPSTLYNRIFTRGWSVEKSLNTPIRYKTK